MGAPAAGGRFPLVVYSAGFVVAAVPQLNPGLWTYSFRFVDAVVGRDASWTLGPENDVVESPFFVPAPEKPPIPVVRRPVGDPVVADAVLDALSSAPRLVVGHPLVPAQHRSPPDGGSASASLTGSGPQKRSSNHWEAT